MASTDYFFEWDSPSPELMRSLISALLYAGISAEDIRRIVSVVPGKLLEIE